MLPQGKFRDLLMADSKEREKIFSQLFQTQIYKQIEDKLKLQAAGIRQAVEQHQNQIKGMLETVHIRLTLAPAVKTQTTVKQLKLFMISLTNSTIK